MAQRSGFRFVALPAVLLLAAFVLTQGRPWTAMRVAGVVLMVPAFALWGIAHVQLGDSFSVRAKARQLVTRGLYSRFRNPIYVFGGIGIAGFVLAIERPEARVREEKFGDEYREYARHTWL
jgi:protein-S-isoprenylcysteine O-methyltransferase Ste14